MVRLRLHFFNSIGRDLSNDVSGHSGIKKVQLCHHQLPRRSGYLGTASVLYKHSEVICYQLD